MTATSDVPIRKRSAHVPRPSTSIERTCDGCGASFLGLAPGKTGERGIWSDWHWYCSMDCCPEDIRDRLYPKFDTGGVVGPAGTALVHGVIYPQGSDE